MPEEMKYDPDEAAETSKYRPLVEATRITDSGDENFGRTKVDTALAAEVAWDAASEEDKLRGIDARDISRFNPRGPGKRGEIEGAFDDELAKVARTDATEKIILENEMKKESTGPLRKVMEKVLGPDIDIDKITQERETIARAGTAAAFSSEQLSHDARKARTDAILDEAGEQGRTKE